MNLRYESNSTLCNYQYKTKPQARRKTVKETRDKLCVRSVTLIQEIEIILIAQHYS